MFIYYCYNFNWYILLNGKHFDRIPQRHILITSSQTFDLGDVVFHFRLSVSQTNGRHPLPLSLPHMFVRPW